jgi:hypothetical protein
VAKTVNRFRVTDELHQIPFTKFNYQNVLSYFGEKKESRCKVFVTVRFSKQHCVFRHKINVNMVLTASVNVVSPPFIHFPILFYKRELNLYRFEPNMQLKYRSGVTRQAFLSLGNNHQKK